MDYSTFGASMLGMIAYENIIPIPFSITGISITGQGSFMICLITKA